MFHDSWVPGSTPIPLAVRCIGGERSGMLTTMVKWWTPDKPTAEEPSHAPDL